MASPSPSMIRRNALVLLLAMALGACASASAPPMRAMSAHECMTRVMYFESNRSSPEGMVAVGTVVMNRLASGKYPRSVCGVIGQKNQFAPGVLTRSMGKGRELASRMAAEVLRGERHPNVAKAMFFHTAGMTFPYTNMHYLIEAGGNVFYEKRKNARRLSDPPFSNGQRASARASRSEVRLVAAAAPAPFPPAHAAAPVVHRPAPVVHRAAPIQARLEPMSIEDLIAINGG